MILALLASLLFTFTYATLAAKVRRAEILLVPVLDILQSVPILGFISVTIVAFMALFPGSLMGAELAAIFAIFTSQAWNMAFSFYQGLRTLPKDLDEAARSFRLSAWLRFWRVEVPFAMPGLVWNMMMSMSGGWFFVVAAEAISVGNTTIQLPGIGSYIALAIEQQDLARDRLGRADDARRHPALRSAAVPAAGRLVRAIPLRADGRPGAALLLGPHRPAARPLDSGARHPASVDCARLTGACCASASARAPADRERRAAATLIGDAIWYAAVAVGIAYVVWRVAEFSSPAGSASATSSTPASPALATFARVVVLIALASAVWVPIGVWIGLRPRAGAGGPADRAVPAAFPANLLFPIAVFAIHRFALDPDIWLSPLMVLGTQWYILFNVIAGAVGVSDRSALRGGQSRRARLAMVAARDLAGHISLLSHRRDHRDRRLLERQRRRRVCQLGRQQADGLRHRRLHRAGDGDRRLSAASCSASP